MTPVCRAYPTPADSQTRPSGHPRLAPDRLQDKYPETVLFFPRQGQTCHAYCTYCFRWAQFVNEPDLKMASDDIGVLVAYLGEHPEVTSVLITGGDPMVMASRCCAATLSRCSTRAWITWSRSGSAPSRCPTGRSGSSPTPTPTRRFSCPTRWSPRGGRKCGWIMVPYYMFVERDTGPQNYFAVPPARGCEIFREDYHSVSSVGRTVRGRRCPRPPGKVCVDGVTEVTGIKIFVLRTI